MQYYTTLMSTPLWIPLLWVPLLWVPLLYKTLIHPVYAPYCPLCTSVHPKYPIYTCYTHPYPHYTALQSCAISVKFNVNLYGCRRSHKETYVAACRRHKFPYVNAYIRISFIMSIQTAKPIQHFCPRSGPIMVKKRCIEYMYIRLYTPKSHFYTTFLSAKRTHLCKNFVVKQHFCPRSGPITVKTMNATFLSAKRTHLAKNVIK